MVCERSAADLEGFIGHRVFSGHGLAITLDDGVLHTGEVGLSGCRFWLRNWVPTDGICWVSACGDDALCAAVQARRYAVVELGGGA